MPSLATLLRTSGRPGAATLAVGATLALGSAIAVMHKSIAFAGDATKGVVVAQAAPTPAPAAPAPSKNSVFTPEQKAAIQQIVKEYFLENPEAFLEIQTALEAKMDKIQAERTKVALKENAKEIFKRTNAPIAGNPNGDVTVVEFFDYNCGYCKRAFQDLAKLVEKDKKVKLVLKELPILSKGSEEAARIALAARMQGKYWEVHRALLTVRGAIDEQSGLKAVEKLPGLDMAKLRKDMESPDVKAEIALVRDLAQKMGIQGTPHFLIGDRVIPGAPGNLLEQIEGHVAELRKTGCSVC
jgi:protein-disulfide isomerase